MEGEARESKLVFIGKNLDPKALNAGFNSCLDTPELRAEGQSRKSLTKAEGPARLVATKGYSTTSAISTFSKVEAKAVLRRGTSDCASIPDTRVAQRLFGEGGPGRAKRLSTGLQVSLLGIDYDPIMDSCLEAFARML